MKQMYYYGLINFKMVVEISVITFSPCIPLQGITLEKIKNPKEGRD